ncbi:MAG: adenylosuccinate synthase [Polyangiales bacterium]
MTIAAVVGANWGDEGKGRLVDALATEHDVVVRFQGGPNAGHTVINPLGRFVLHTLPSGVFQPHVTNVLGPGVALDPDGLQRELQGLAERGVPTPRLAISPRAGLLLPHQALLDQLEEQRLGARAFGSTRSGIAPHYAERCEKRGLQVDDLFDTARCEQRVAEALELVNLRLVHGYGHPPLSAAEISGRLLAHRSWLEPLVVDTTALLQAAHDGGQRVLFEGQLGALRDPDLGIYPYVTSSSPLASHALVGAGLPASALTDVVAVTKAYASCVGAGPFPTELFGPEADELRERGGDNGEYGRTTGRPRRVGGFDAVATRYGCRIQGATQLALTCLDVLGYQAQIPVCTAYSHAGATLAAFPTTRVLETVQPVYETLPGWGVPISHVRRFSQLPAAAQRYVERIEQLVGVPIRWISVSPERSGLIRR